MNQDFTQFARWLTRIEKAGAQALKEGELLEPPQLSFRLGITGPPGAGKSTLIAQLIDYFSQQKMTVGVLAIDPSSPFTQGAILGDRIRYADQAMSKGVFVRSLGTRGSLGGLSAAVYLMLRAFDVAGFDIVLIETVGVGQTELEVVSVADFVSVVLVPESGDSIQAMKAGLLEIADLFVVNKADRPGAESLVRELEASVKLGRDLGATKQISVFKTVATKGEGLALMADHIHKVQTRGAWQGKRTEAKRLQWEARALLRDRAERTIAEKVRGIQTPQDLLKALQ